MKKITLYLLPALLTVACNNNKPADSATANSSTAADTKGISKSELYGKWKLDNAIVKVDGPDGKVMMNDTMKGAPGDYYLISDDGAVISHIGKMVDTGKFKFISDDELVGVNQTGKDSARIKILSLTSSACTLSFKQKKSTGSVDMTTSLIR